jgi:cholesterol oxidase
MLVMQTEDNHLRMRLGRSIYTLFRRGLVSQVDAGKSIPHRIESGHRVTRTFAQKSKGIPLGSINEGLLGVALTAHVLGGCPFGDDAHEGVIGLDCQVHRYAGLYVIDGSIIPANPGVNPSLTIAAFAEYAMSMVPEKEE